MHAQSYTSVESLLLFLLLLLLSPGVNAQCGTTENWDGTAYAFPAIQCQIECEWMFVLGFFCFNPLWGLSVKLGMVVESLQDGNTELKLDGKTGRGVNFHQTEIVHSEKLKCIHNSCSTNIKHRSCSCFLFTGHWGHLLLMQPTASLKEKSCTK